MVEVVIMPESYVPMPMPMIVPVDAGPSSEDIKMQLQIEVCRAMDTKAEMRVCLQKVEADYIKRNHDSDVFLSKAFGLVAVAFVLWIGVVWLIRR